VAGQQRLRDGARVQLLTENSKTSETIGGVKP